MTILDAHVHVVAAASQTKSPDGALGLLVFLVLAVVVVFLFRSMNKHLRKARQINYDDQPDAEAQPRPGRRR